MAKLSGLSQSKQSTAKSMLSLSKKYVVLALWVIVCTTALLSTWTLAVWFPDQIFLSCWLQDKHSVTTRFGCPDETCIENGRTTMVYHTGINVIRLGLDQDERVWTMSITQSD